MKWVWIKPSVVRWQMKKVANSTQKTFFDLFVPSRKATRSGAKASEAKPTLGFDADDGVFAIWRQADVWGDRATAASAKKPARRREWRTTKASAARQPQCSGNRGQQRQEDEWTGGVAGGQQADGEAAAGREPRVATVAPSTSAVMREPSPTITPQNSSGCSSSCSGA